MKGLEKYLTLNSILLATLFLILGSGVFRYYFQKVDVYEPPTGALPVPQQVGKNKLIQSKTGDASLAIETKRRRTIIGANSCGLKDPRFGFWNKSSTNGSMETYFITGLCPRFTKDSVECTIYDAGDAFDEYDLVLDANGGANEQVLDLSNAFVRDCKV